MFSACLTQHAYGKHENEVMESAMPSPVEKGDRGAVDQGYPGIKEGGERRKQRFTVYDGREGRYFLLYQMVFMWG